MDLVKILVDIIEEKGLWSSPVLLERNELFGHRKLAQTHLYFLESGAIRAFTTVGDNDYTVRLIYKGNLFGYLDAFMSDQPSNMELEVLRKSSIRYISKSDFQSLLEIDSDILKLWIELIQALLVQFMEREIDLLNNDPSERLKKVLERSPEVFQEIPLKYIASYLRMSPETLSRIMNS